MKLANSNQKITTFFMFTGKAKEAMKHEFTFTPSVSLFVTCDSEEEINGLFEKLSLEGKVLMPLSPSPVSALFGLVEDRYGISWQLNLGK